MRWSPRKVLLAALLASAAGAASAQPPLRLPLQCAPGVDCWISNHVDLDPGSGRRDYSCGALTYNAHNGTDFALRDLNAMRAGVAVLAAAAGTVLGSRDGMPDASVRETGLAPVRDRECGNGLRLDHGEGLETQYCHLRLGSVTVRPGERVVAGQALGLVGMSGLSEYPHLHFTVRFRGTVIDPFRGAGPGPACGTAERPLWDREVLAALPYAPGAVYNYGIAPLVPAATDVRQGKHNGRSLPQDAAQLVVWLEAFGVTAGDELNVRVVAAGGQMLFEHHTRLERTQARVFRAVGRKRGSEPWHAGAYTAEVTLGRGAVHRLSFEVR